MTRDAEWIVVVTYREWLTWTACGALRIGAGRRTKLKEYGHKPSREAFEKLMDKAPDVSRWEDQAYLVAYLRRTPPKCDSGTFTDLRLVTGFHPLSARGHALLKGDAERALVKLGNPVYEDRWRGWAEANLESLRVMSARHLVSACRLPELDTEANFDLDVLLRPTSTLRDRADGLDAKGFDKKVRHGKKLARQPAYGWWLALMVFKRRLKEDAADAFTAEAKRFIDRAFGEMESVEAFPRAVTSWETAMAFASTTSNRFPDELNPSLPMMAVIYHYQHAIAEFGMIDYQALGEDLRFLKDGAVGGGIEQASLAAWCIGWHLDSATATALHSAAVPRESCTVLDLDQVPRIPAISGQQELCGQPAANDGLMPSDATACASTGGV